ncbi:MAG: hypothetical protein GY699_05390 [Desulfobacteraceae bacterium]|nr:hypothetical protein [Desulfobacteraceae bacterium]
MMDVKISIKIAAAIAMIFGIAYGLLDLIYQPHYLRIDGTKGLPSWFRWFGWIISSLAVFAYLFIDFYDRFSKNQCKDKDLKD